MRPSPQDSITPDKRAAPPADRYGSAPSLTRFIGILNIILGSLEFLAAIVLFFVGSMLAAGIITPGDYVLNLHQEPPRSPEAPTVVSAESAGWIILAAAALTLLVACLKIIAGVKLTRKNPRTWGFALAAGIAGCLELWYVYYAFIPMAAGLFTIVACCRGNVRRYLRDLN